MSRDLLSIARDCEQESIAHQVGECRRHLKVRKLIPRGYCYNCGAHVSLHQLYCDDDCEIDHEKRMERRANETH